MFKCVKAIVLFVSVAVLPASAYAQASIVGTVRDASGAVLPGVTVEASSPALIEKTRSVVTNGVGQYAIEDLRPGTYTVTFTLAGFATVKREGIELTGSFIATVNADLKVGGVAETITVTGETPVVDVTSTRNQQVISGQTVAEIPSSRQYSAFTHLIPAINVQQNDFEGSNPALYSVFQIHGGRRNEGQVLVDGMSGGYQGMGVSGYVPEVGNSQEVVFSLSGGLGEATTGGPQMNIIRKQGGNMFAGSFFVSGTGSGLQGDNLTPEMQGQGADGHELRSRSCGTSTLRSAARSSATSCGSSARSATRSAGRTSPACGSTRTRAIPRNGPTTRTRASRPSTTATWKNGSARLTWQATPRNKINVWTSVQYSLPALQRGRRRYRAWLRRVDQLARGDTDQRKPPEHADAIELDVAGHLAPAARSQRATGALLLVGQPSEEFVRYDDDSGAGERPAPFRASTTGRPTGPGTPGFTNIVQGSASYITGSHSAKFGFRYHQQRLDVPEQLLQQLAAQVQLHRTAFPTQVTVYADADSHQEQQQSMFALYAQDRWTTRPSVAAGRTPLRAPRRLLP